MVIFLQEKQIKKVLFDNKEKPAVLDLGCGTGLVGESLCHLAEAIDGVDLSPKMLESTLSQSETMDRKISVPGSQMRP